MRFDPQFDQGVAVLRPSARRALERRRLVLENDDLRFSAADVLWIHERCGVPLIFDYQHFWCLNPEGLALRPTLVSLYGGGNDILRPSIDVDALMADYDEAFGRLRASGAQVLTLTGFDVKHFYGVFKATRGRTAIYNELLREIAEKHDLILVEFWRFSEEFSDARYWAKDRLHMNTLGHIKMAGKVLEALQVGAGELGLEPLPQMREVSRVQATRANLEWVRTFALPWVGRRLRGTSSGDSLSPRYPDLQSLQVTEGGDAARGREEGEAGAPPA